MILYYRIFIYTAAKTAPYFCQLFTTAFFDGAAQMIRCRLSRSVGLAGSARAFTHQLSHTRDLGSPLRNTGFGLHIRFMISQLGARAFSMSLAITTILLASMRRCFKILAIAASCQGMHKVVCLFSRAFRFSTSRSIGPFRLPAKCHSMLLFITLPAFIFNGGGFCSGPQSFTG